MIKTLQKLLVFLWVVKVDGKDKKINKWNPLTYVMIFIAAIIASTVSFFETFIDTFKDTLKK
jgi:hypothetical protein